MLSTALAEAGYAATLRALPACAREWFAALPERHRAAAIECYSTAVVSPGLVHSGLAAAGAGTSPKHTKHTHTLEARALK